jgi:type IX secretion system PorP/SprF family membrane protein
MKKILLAVSFVTTLTYCFSQQQAAISQYMLNNYYFNPAYTGSGELYNFSMLHRSQWSGYKDYNGDAIAPETQLLTGNMNFDSTGHAIGILMSRDKITPLTTYQAQLSYAYRVRLTKKSILALGVRGGLVTQSIDYQKYIVKHPDDEYIREGKQSETQPDATLGLWLEHEKYYAGVSAHGIVIQSDYTLPGLQNEKTIVATMGYHFNLVRQWRLTPTAQLITNTDQTTVQYSALLDHDNGFYTGFAYRQQDAATFLVGFAMLQKKLRLSYAFDYTIENRSSKAGNSHEVMISSRFGKWHRLQRTFPSAKLR